MGTSSYLATTLDVEMLRANGAAIAPSTTPLNHLPALTANQLAAQLGGRYLLRYLFSTQIAVLLAGTSATQHLTPTPYAPEEAIPYLALPAPDQVRPYVLLLDPARLTAVRGPRLVRLGLGVEYIATQGFQRAAIVNVSPDPGASGWPLAVR